MPDGPRIRVVLPGGGAIARSRETIRGDAARIQNEIDALRAWAEPSSVRFKPRSGSIIQPQVEASIGAAVFPDHGISVDALTSELTSPCMWPEEYPGLSCTTEQDHHSTRRLALLSEAELRRCRPGGPYYRRSSTWLPGP